MRFRTSSSCCARLFRVFMDNPWDILPLEPKGDSDQASVYLAVGIATTVWEQLDEAQAGLFKALVRSRSSAAEAAYGKIISGPSRSTMVAAAAKQVISDKTLRQRVTKLLKDVRRLAVRRNDIAHGMVCVFSSLPLGTSELVEEGCYLVPPEYTRKHAPEEKWEFDRLTLTKYKYAWTSAQIRAYVDHFIDYRRKLTAITEEVNAYCKEKFS